jgi:hypothetical protein
MGELPFEASQANSSQDTISKITKAKWTRGVTQVVEHHFATVKPSSNLSPTKKKKKKQPMFYRLIMV